MHRHRTPRAVQRAQWFSDLTSALSEAEKLLGMIDAGNGYPAEAACLRRRIQLVRSELAVLNKVILSEERVIGTWPDPAPPSALDPKPRPEAPRPRRTAP